MSATRPHNQRLRPHSVPALARRKARLPLDPTIDVASVRRFVAWTINREIRESNNSHMVRSAHPEQSTLHRHRHPHATLSASLTVWYTPPTRPRKMERFNLQRRVKMNEKSSESLDRRRNDDGEGTGMRPSENNVTEDQEPFMGVKVRRKTSFHREFNGDYIDVRSNQYLMKLLQKQGSLWSIFSIFCHLFAISKSFFCFSIFSFCYGIEKFRFGKLC